MSPFDVCFKCQNFSWEHLPPSDHEFIPHPALFTEERMKAKQLYETYQQALQKAYPDDMSGEAEPWDLLDSGEHEAWLEVLRAARK